MRNKVSKVIVGKNYYNCVCTDACDTTLCYCLAIKQKECESQCKCNPSVCKNKVLLSLASSSTPSSAPSTTTAKKT